MTAREILRGIRGRLLAALRFTLLLVSSRRVLIEGESMAPAVVDGDRLLVSRLAYRLAAPRRGDIVLLRDPSRPGSECIKRIVALPGEQVRQEGLSVTVGASRMVAEVTQARTWQLGRGEYFVTGDNLAHSTDSRSFGPVAGAALIGKVWYRYAGRQGRRGRLDTAAADAA